MVNMAFTSSGVRCMAGLYGQGPTLGIAFRAYFFPGNLWEKWAHNGPFELIGGPSGAQGMSSQPRFHPV